MQGFRIQPQIRYLSFSMVLLQSIITISHHDNFKLKGNCDIDVGSTLSRILNLVDVGNQLIDRFREWFKVKKKKKVWKIPH